MYKKVFNIFTSSILVIFIHNGESQGPKIGSAINVFKNYGFLTRTMRVFPTNDSQSWIFREPTFEIFDYFSIKPPEERKVLVFDGDIKIEFCEDEEELLEAYFKNFTIEFLDKPWHAFVQNRSAPAVLRIFGIDEAAVSDEYSYILIKVARFRERQQLRRDLVLSEEINRGVENLRTEKLLTALKFIDQFGSHYIDSFVTGDLLYQVFAFTPKKVDEIKQYLITYGVKNLLNKKIFYYFSPKFAEFVGKIKSASGNPNLEGWTKVLRDPDTSHQNLLKVYGDKKLLRLFNAVLGNEALLSLHLKTIVPLLEKESKRKFFEEFLFNYFKLWEVSE